jgi:hypothetical protein
LLAVSRAPKNSTQRACSSAARTLDAFAIALAATFVTSAYAEGGNPFLLQQVHEIIRTQPADGTGTRWFALARPYIGMDVMPGMQGMFGARASAAASEPFSLWRDRPAAIETPLAKGAFPDPLFFVVNPVRNVLQAGRSDAGIRTDLYEALLWQAGRGVGRPSHAAGTAPGPRGTFDLAAGAALGGGAAGSPATPRRRGPGAGLRLHSYPANRPQQEPSFEART